MIFFTINPSLEEILTKQIPFTVSGSSTAMADETGFKQYTFCPKILYISIKASLIEKLGSIKNFPRLGLG